MDGIMSKLSDGNVELRLALLAVIVVSCELQSTEQSPPNTVRFTHAEHDFDDDDPSLGGSARQFSLSVRTSKDSGEPQYSISYNRKYHVTDLVDYGNHLVHVHYPSIEIGHTIPMYENCYRVKRVDKRRNDDEGITVTALLIERIAKSDLPMETRLLGDFYTVPHQGRLAVLIPRPQNLFETKDNRIALQVLNIKRMNPTIVATVETNYLTKYKDGPSSQRHKRKYENVTVGMAVPIHQAGLRVRKIVPPIPMHKIAGWVEFDPEPITFGTLEPHKIAVETPEPK